MYLYLKHNKTLIIDDTDFFLLKDYNWYALKDGEVYYAVAGVPKKLGGPGLVKMHRLIMNAQPGQQVDHINGNGLDNRRENLRFCTNAQNQMNRHKSNGSSEYKGVYWNKRANKWHSHIRINGIMTHLGYFTEELEAAKAYDIAAKELFGEFASVNGVN